VRKIAANQIDLLCVMFAITPHEPRVTPNGGSRSALGYDLLPLLALGALRLSA
jgi:hypothetical protein